VGSRGRGRGRRAEGGVGFAGERGGGLVYGFGN